MGESRYTEDEHAINLFSKLFGDNVSNIFMGKYEKIF